MNYQIIPLFRDLLPPQKSRNKEMLKDSIRSEGKCLSPLILAQFPGDPSLYLLDGHHRNAIAAELRAEGVEIAEPQYVVKEFAGRFDACKWAREHDETRREATPQERIAAVMRNNELVEMLEAEAAARQNAGKAQKPPEAADDSEGDLGAALRQGTPGRVSEQLAALADTSPRTVENYRAVMRSGDGEVINRLFSSEPEERLSINAAVKQVRANAIRRATPAYVSPENRHWEDQIWRGDNRELLKQIPDGAATMFLFSPPYPTEGVEYIDRHGTVYVYDEGKYRAWLRDLRTVLKEAFRATREGGRLVVNVDNTSDRIAGTQHQVDFDVRRLAQRCGWTYRNNICWYKQTTSGNRPNWGTYASPRNPRIRPNHEHIALSRPSESAHFSRRAFSRDAVDDTGC
jgi:hypothetical protein